MKRFGRFLGGKERGRYFGGLGGREFFVNESGGFRIGGAVGSI